MALGIAFFLCQIQLDYLESYFYDLRVKLRPTPETSGHIQTIVIDTHTQEALRRMPESLDYMKLAEELKKASPKAVIFIVEYDEMESIIGSYEELELLADSLKQLNFYVAIDDRLPTRGLEEEFRLLPPLQDIQVGSAPSTRDTNNFARDGVTRRLILGLHDEPLLHAKLASQFNGISQPSKYQGAFDFKRTEQAYINYRPTGTYRPLSFVTVANGEFDPHVFEDKIVLIGKDTKANINDYVQTPYSRDALAMSKVELHANILDTLILDEAPILTPHWLNVAITAAISILTVFVVLTVRPAHGLYLLIVAMAGYFAFSLLLFITGNLWLSMVHPLLAIFICYYFFIPYRLIIENRKSWEYFQKNKLLTQVEELKSNFLQMMSHDLKTPLARIQGMTEVALRDPNPLSKGQLEAIQNINKSSEELSQFVGSVLNLGRIESKDINKLHLKSKDINALVHDVIQKCDYLAKQKNIELETDLEPMFSLKIDEDLMKQVLTNLVENAIKYSPENTKVQIKTEEIEGKVYIKVSDHGAGIPKSDIENLFTKFYRARQARNSDVKGSGLGLYLARYFVNLHSGDINVESEVNKGSTFTVELPMNLH